MTWPGESGPTSSGLFTYTSDGSPGELFGSQGQIIMWENGVPGFYQQASLTGIILSSINQIVDINTSGVSVGQILKWDGLSWVPSDSFYGSEYNYIESLSQSTTTAQGPSSWTQKLRLSATLPSGTYMVNWSCGLGLSDNDGGKVVDVQLELDDITQLATGSSKIKFTGDEPDSDVMQSQGGIVQIIFTTSTSHTFDLDFHISSRETGTAYIDNARIALWRVK